MSNLYLPALASDCFSAARMFLNDNGIPTQLWTDAILMPMLKQAHLELQAKLRQRASQSMRSFQTRTIPAFDTGIIPAPIDILLPIRLYEKPSGAPVSSFQIMTETDMLPLISPGNTMTWWMWDEDEIVFVGANISTDIFLDYWRRIPVPTTSSEEIGVIDGEQYLGPRIAAIAAASVGEEATSAIANALAETQLQIVLSANKTRATPAPVASLHP